MNCKEIVTSNYIYFYFQIKSNGPLLLRLSSLRSPNEWYGYPFSLSFYRAKLPPKDTRQSCWFVLCGWWFYMVLWQMCRVGGLFLVGYCWFAAECFRNFWVFESDLMRSSASDQTCSFFFFLLTCNIFTPPDVQRVHEIGTKYVHLQSCKSLLNKVHRIMRCNNHVGEKVLQLSRCSQQTS